MPAYTETDDSGQAERPSALENLRRYVDASLGRPDDFVVSTAYVTLGEQMELTFGDLRAVVAEAKAEALGDLMERTTQAADRLETAAGAALIDADQERLASKAQGVRLVASYIHDAQRTQS